MGSIKNREARPPAHQPPGLSDRAALFHFAFCKESEVGETGGWLICTTIKKSRVLDIHHHKKSRWPGEPVVWCSCSTIKTQLREDKKACPLATASIKKAYPHARIGWWVSQLTP